MPSGDGGRAKGTPNKKTLEYREKIQKYARSKHYDPIIAMIRMAISRSKLITPELRLRCHEIVAKYMASQLKPIDAETGSSDEVVRYDSVLSHAYEQAYKDTNGKDFPANGIAQEKTHAIHSPGSDR